MNIQFKLELSDILAMQADVIQSSYAHDIKRKYFKWIISIVILVVGLVSLLKTSSFTTLATSIIIAAIFFIFAPKLYNKIAYARLKKQILQQDHSKLFKPCTMQFSEAGINRIIDGETDDFSWDKFTRHSEDGARYFLYVSDLQGLIIPKSPANMEQDGDIIDFQKTFMGYVEENVKKD